MTPMSFMTDYCTGVIKEVAQEDGWIHVLYKDKFYGKYKKDMSSNETDRWGVTFDESVV